jgi:hypothetical protein
MRGTHPVLVRANGHAYHFEARSGLVRKLVAAQVKEVQETFGNLTAFVKKEEEEISLNSPIIKAEWTDADPDVSVTRFRTADGLTESAVAEEPRGRRNLARSAKTKSVEKLRMFPLCVLTLCDID